MSETGKTLRVIAFGAHPDDCELKAGGVAAKWAARGHNFIQTVTGRQIIGEEILNETA